MAVIADTRVRARAVWAGGVALAGLVGFVVGLSGILGQPEAPVDKVSLIGAVAGPVAALDCPDGAVVAGLDTGDRVLVTARSEDGAFLAVRLPGAQYETVWVATEFIEVSLEAAAVPVDGCITPEVVIE